MKIKITLLVTTLAFLFSTTIAQTPLKEYKAGGVFYISVPDYMSKTVGLNSSASVQFKNTVKDVYTFVIVDNKEELTLAELNYTSVAEFFEDFVKDFLEGEKKREVSKPVYQKKNDLNIAECEASYYDTELKGEIYYYVGVVETKTAYYKVLSWVLAENKEKYKADFQSILYSVKD